MKGYLAWFFCCPKREERNEGVQKTGKLVASSLFIAFGVMLPIAFHFFGDLGQVFLPMHIPVLIAGLFLGGYSGLAVGVLTPLFSSLLTGMPPVMPSLPVMAAELAVYGAVGGCLYNVRRWNLYVSLATAMVAGRLAAAMVLYGMATLLNIDIRPEVYVKAKLVVGLPGVIIQLAVVPLLVKRLQAVFVKYACKE